MEKVVVQTGAKTYQITDQDGNDLGVFRFIPSDAGILKRYKEAAAFFTGINDKIKDKDFEEILPDLEKEAGEKIDLLFGAPVSESFFKITSPFTVLESGETFADYHCNWWNHRKRAGCKGKGAAEKDKKVY